MALPKQQIKPDSPEVIAARMRERPADKSIVLAKTNEGIVVAPLSSGMTHRWPDGIERRYMPWTEPIDEATAKKLKNGVADQYEFRWVGKLQMAEARGDERWRPVKKADNLVVAPYAYSEENDAFIWRVDTMLHMREVTYGDQVRRESAMLNSPSRILADAQNTMNEAAETAMRKSKQPMRVNVITPEMAEVPEEAINVVQSEQ